MIICNDKMTLIGLYIQYRVLDFMLVRQVLYIIDPYGTFIVQVIPVLDPRQPELIYEISKFFERLILLLVRRHEWVNEIIQLNMPPTHFVHTRSPGRITPGYLHPGPSTGGTHCCNSCWIFPEPEWLVPYQACLVRD